MLASFFSPSRFRSLASPAQFLLPATLLGFLGSGRLFPRVFRRPFFGFLNPFMGLASLLSLVTVVLVVLLLVNPAFLNHSFPAWKHTIGIAAFGFSLFAILGCVLRSFKIVLLTAFWIFAALLLGKEALGFRYGLPQSTKKFDPSRIVGGEAVGLFDKSTRAAPSAIRDAISSATSLGSSVFEGHSEFVDSGLPDDAYYAKPFRSKSGGNGKDLSSAIEDQKENLTRALGQVIGK